MRTLLMRYNESLIKVYGTQILPIGKSIQIYPETLNRWWDNINKYLKRHQRRWFEGLLFPPQTKRIQTYSSYIIKEIITHKFLNCLFTSLITLCMFSHLTIKIFNLREFFFLSLESVWKLRCVKMYTEVLKIGPLLKNFVPSKRTDSNPTEV